LKCRKNGSDREIKINYKITLMRSRGLVRELRVGMKEELLRMEGIEGGG
jgi:hypothetical protein